MGDELTFQTLVPTLVPGLMLLTAMTYSVLILKRFLQVTLADDETPPHASE